MQSIVNNEESNHLTLSDLHCILTLELFKNFYGIYIWAEEITIVQFIFFNLKRYYFIVKRDASILLTKINLKIVVY